MQHVKSTTIRWLYTLLLGCFLLTPSISLGNAQFKKALQHFKDFEVKQAVSILKKLQEDNSLSKEMKAKVALYLGMSYAYLRKTPEAKAAFAQAIQIQPNVQLPPKTPKRLQNLFQEVKLSGAGSGSQLTPKPPTRPQPRPAIRFGGDNLTPPAQRTPDAFPPTRRVDPIPPTKRVEPTPPPRRRTMSFGMGFTIRRRPPPPRRVEVFPPARRVEIAPPARRVEVFPPARQTTQPDPIRSPQPTPAKRKTASLDPDATSLFGKSTAKAKKTGNATMWTLAWTATGTAIVLAAGGGVFGVFANNVIGQVKQNIVQIDIPQAQKDADRYALFANIFYASAGAVAVSAVIFFVFAAQKPKPKTTASLSNKPLKEKSLLPAKPNHQAIPQYVFFDSQSQ